ncbi:MAG: electron transfer flavoprotein subunit alpha/FixB family protein, partial [Gracilibacteraceae bacterium]|nr:electron transfer flavoprotein subunit alpha/FixB family protein [Gracilibacteraceae bacterium]
TTIRPAVQVEQLAADNGTAMRLVETIEAEGGAGLLTATRVVSVGMGLAAKNDLKLIEELAQAARAEMACTLPVCDDMHWLPAACVVGSSHSQVGPELYFAIGISGQPQHMSGIRDARIVVAVNSDPEARIFKHCSYGIVGDLYKVVPALISEFNKAG